MVIGHRHSLAFIPSSSFGHQPTPNDTQHIKFYHHPLEQRDPSIGDYNNPGHRSSIFLHPCLLVLADDIHEHDASLHTNPN